VVRKNNPRTLGFIDCTKAATTGCVPHFDK
jgi:hypothetical protein